jgi:hypothetical protein
MKSATPKANLQVEMPTTMVAALDLIAKSARRGEGVTRSHLVRAVLAEYIELKLGPDLRNAIAAWDKHGGDVLMEFMRQTVPPVMAEVGHDPLNDRMYAPQNEADPLYKALEFEAQHKAEGGRQNHGRRPPGGDYSRNHPLGTEPEFVQEAGIAPPNPTPEEYLKEDPSRKYEPLPEHFPLRTGFNQFKP